MITPLQKKILAQADELVLRAERIREFAQEGSALGTLENLAAGQDQLTELTDCVARWCRVTIEPASWSQIADPFGMSKQGAQQRWG